MKGLSKRSSCEQEEGKKINNFLMINDFEGYSTISYPLILQKVKPFVDYLLILDPHVT